MSQYKIPFGSYTFDYEIRIYPATDGWQSNGDTVTLTGASSPITTEYSGEEEITCPVRTGCGYIRFVTSDYDLLSGLMPKEAGDMRVTLVRKSGGEEAIVWEGYIKPEAYDQQWNAGPWEVEIPIVDHLSVMMDKFLSDTNTNEFGSGFLSIGQFLTRICGDVLTHVAIKRSCLLERGSMRLTADVFDTTKDVVTPHILECAFDENKFKEPVQTAERVDKTDMVNNIWDPGTNNDIASSLCTMLGWCMYQYGTTLVCYDTTNGYDICTALTENQYNIYAKSQLTAENPTVSSTVNNVRMNLAKYTYPEYSDEIEDDDPAVCNENGSRGVIMPYGKVAVTGAQDEYQDIVINAGDKDWQQVGSNNLINGGMGIKELPAWGDEYGEKLDFITQRICNHPEVTQYQYHAGNYTVSFRDGTEKSYTYFTPVPNIYKPHSIVLMNTLPNLFFGSSSGQYANIKYNTRGSGVGNNYFGGGEICGISYGGTSKKDSVLARSIYLVNANYTVNGVEKPRKALTIKSTLAHFLPHSERLENFVCLRLTGNISAATDVRTVIPSGSATEGKRYSVKVSIKIGSHYLINDTYITNKVYLADRATEESAIFDLIYDSTDEGKLDFQFRLNPKSGFEFGYNEPIEITFWTPTKIATLQNGTTVAVNYNGVVYQRITGLKLEITTAERPDRYAVSTPFIDDPKSTIEIKNKVAKSKFEELSIETKFGAHENPIQLLYANPVTVYFMDYSQGAGGTSYQVTGKYFPVRNIGQYDCNMEGSRKLCQRIFDNAAGTDTHTGWSTKPRVKASMSFRFTDYTAQFPAVMHAFLENHSMIANRKVEWSEDEVEISIVEDK